MGWRDRVEEKNKNKVANKKVDVGASASTPPPTPKKKTTSWKERVAKKQKSPVTPIKPVKEVEPQPEINNKYNFDHSKTYLVVSGKIKEISSKSKYLLDMLIIEEEN